MTELQTCRYSHGKCKQPRATKKNGTMHTLCEFHRTKACAHQKKLDAKRRNEKLRLLESKKAMKHAPSGTADMHLWKEDENRMPMIGDKFKSPVWDSAHDSAAAMYPPTNPAYGHHHHHTPGHLPHHAQHHSSSQQHTPRDLYEYDDHQRYTKFPSAPSNQGGLLRSGGSPLSSLRRDDTSSSFRPQFPPRGDGAYPSYSSPTSYSGASTYADSVSYDHKHQPASQRLHHHHVPHHMTTGEFDARYDYYDDAPSPYSRSSTSALTFGQYPPQPVYHQ